jgi:hypothetical protein
MIAMTRIPTTWLLAALLLPVGWGRAEAATYCVGSVAELRSALNAAAASPENDEIRIRSGIYATGGTAFVYASPNSGWVGLYGGFETQGSNPCGRRVLDASVTRLTAGGTSRVLVMQHNAPPDALATRFIVDNLTLEQGAVPNGDGGALDMFSVVEAPNEFWLDNVIIRESSANFGGGASLYLRRGLVKITNSLFHGNSAAYASSHITLTQLFGAATPSVILSGNTFVGGSCPGAGGRGCGIRLALGGTVAAQIRNSVFHANMVSDVTTEGLTVIGYGSGTIGYADSLVPLTNGNLIPTVLRPLVGSPGFVDATGGDFRPRDDSILVNRGWSDTPFYPTNVFDLRGSPRVVGFSRDVGAYENQERLFRDSLEEAASP